ncbi:MAG: ABC transporter ATP-binding protein, partial [Rhodococcus sp.]|nr:ABC transporter ATP-binding protein [Rhodococcus sp. (in: high G+C Gram-positive bacteria)]
MKELVSDLKWLWPLLRPHRWFVSLGCAAVLMQTAVGLSIPFLVKIAIDRGVIAQSVSVLAMVVAVYIGVVVIRAIAEALEILAVGRVGQTALHELRLQAFNKAQKSSLDFHHEEGPGGVVARVVGDVDSLASLLTDGLVRFATSILTIGGVVALLIVLDPGVSVALLLAVPPLLVLVMWFRRVSTPAWRAVRGTAGRAMRSWHETIQTAGLLRSFGTSGNSFETLTNAVDEEAGANRRTVDISAKFFPAVDLIAAAVTVTIVIYGGFGVLGGSVEIGTFTAFMLYLRLAFGPISGLSQLFDSVQSGLAGAQRLRAVMDREPDPPAPQNPTPLPTPAGQVRFDAVDFAYPSGPPVLHALDWSVQAGETVALVGVTGAGKSTIAKLVLRFYDPTAGRVQIDGIDVRDLAEDDLRRATAYVPQETILFSGTVADNIALERPDV